MGCGDGMREVVKMSMEGCTHSDEAYGHRNFKGIFAFYKFFIKLYFNLCSFPVWVGTKSGGNNPELSPTHFQLDQGSTSSLSAGPGWSGRFWGRSGRFSCLTGDCSRGQVSCTGDPGGDHGRLLRGTGLLRRQPGGRLKPPCVADAGGRESGLPDGRLPIGSEPAVPTGTGGEEGGRDGGGVPELVLGIRGPKNRYLMGSQSGYDYSFKILLIGDSGVGKSSLLVSFISSHIDGLSPTIGVDFKIKHLIVGGKRLKLTIWDTAGQEKFRTLTSSYFRNAQGIILVYDVTQRETFTNIVEVWVKELELYSTNQDCIKVLVGNKVDKESERVITEEEGIAFAQDYGCYFLECSAKTRANVEKCFAELAHKILQVPSLLEEGSALGKKNILKQKQEVLNLEYRRGFCGPGSNK
ncbi:hypothetical protein HPP92_022283 [Vanilla planifolia]|uniref:Uncharacterized protein n=1 Tax=Vanilla planifolia TaxID=51239 RepID=A0A835PRX9_VANPL|nr:hypothetical protein HPP92_022283 [Vanilla planifolia]